MLFRQWLGSEADFDQIPGLTPAAGAEALTTPGQRLELGGSLIPSNPAALPLLSSMRQSNRMIALGIQLQSPVWRDRSNPQRRCVVPIVLVDTRRWRLKDSLYAL